MAPGPALLFDKSALQCLSIDEAAWLDNFFETNITPLFFVQALADLEKQHPNGSPEQFAASLAEKTPVYHSHLNAHHLTIIEAELSGQLVVKMDGRPLVPGAQVVELEGQTGIILRPPPEQEAFSRWQRHEYFDLERRWAKAWRTHLSGFDLPQIYHRNQCWFETRPKPRTLDEAKVLAAQILDEVDKENALLFGLQLLGGLPDAQLFVKKRWYASDCPPLRLFAPYSGYVAGVNLFFYIAFAAGLIGRERPSNLVDLAYLYYLPFCRVFVSRDNLHRRIARVFLSDDQEFIWGDDFKVALGHLNDHYSQLPAETRARVISSFAPCPPLDDAFLVTRVWDKHMPEWRRLSENDPTNIDKDTAADVLERFHRLTETAQPVDPQLPFDSDQAEGIVSPRMIPTTKGKWRLLPAELEGKNDCK